MILFKLCLSIKIEMLSLFIYFIWKHFHIIKFPWVWLFQNIICLFDFNKLLCLYCLFWKCWLCVCVSIRLWRWYCLVIVINVSVWMVPFCQFKEALFNFLICSCWGEIECLVVVEIQRYEHQIMMTTIHHILTNTFQ